jgi:filamentous hemagglutinin
VRGALVVVGEHVKRSQGFSGASSSRNLGDASNVSSVSSVSNRHLTTYISSLGLIAVSASFTASLCVPLTAHAQIIPNRAAPGAQQALVIHAANGVPVVNIQTSSAGGVSHNRYTQFDVAPQGAILNNAEDAVQTKLGGWVMGNALVAGRPASVILNEVNSANPSQLMGVIEVAGKQAQVIVANRDHGVIPGQFAPPKRIPPPGPYREPPGGQGFCGDCFGLLVRLRLDEAKNLILFHKLSKEDETGTGLQR